MATLSENIENRVRKLSKPANAAQALQPLFEAISNSTFAIEDRFVEQSRDLGSIRITVSGIANPQGIEIRVADNGIGLDAERFAAFCEVDTPFKSSRGGKGVGRLFWLDAFQEIRVESNFLEDEVIRSRAFRFHLSNDDQIVEEDALGWAGSDVGTVVTFKGLRSPDYSQQFPRRAETLLRYFSAQFIADFLLGESPIIAFEIDEETTVFPAEVSRLVVGEPLESGAFTDDTFGELSIVGFTCKPEASAGLDGNHQLHLLANGRTVETRKVDNLLGVTSLQRNGETGLVFHACVAGEYLDKHVNEGRTAFNLPEKTLKEISRLCTDIVKARLIPEDIETYNADRRERYVDFVNRYPIYGFDDPDVQLSRVPFHARQPEDFAAGLVKYQVRRDEERQDAIENVITLLESDQSVPENFAAAVIEATHQMQASEQLALAQHVVRRKLVLELLEKLIKRLREREGQPDDHQLESTLHSFICPMGVQGDDASTPKPRAHDLWIVDERLAFTRAFSSDKRLDQILAEGGTADRPDLLLWNLSYGMGTINPDIGETVDISEPLRKMMVVEFKKPMRRAYSKAEDQIEQQIIKYLAQLKGGQLESFGRERIRVADDCIFYCYVIADIVGDLETQLSNWETTANGQGRIRPLKNEYRGSIEVIQWKDLINDAWLRNQATLAAAGMSRSVPSLRRE